MGKMLHRLGGVHQHRHIKRVGEADELPNRLTVPRNSRPGSRRPNGFLVEHAFEQLKVKLTALIEGQVQIRPRLWHIRFQGT